LIEDETKVLEEIFIDLFKAVKYFLKVLEGYERITKATCY